MARGVWLGALLALGVAGEAAAREPLAPVTLRDGEQPWSVQAGIDARRFETVTVRRTVWRKGTALGTKVLAVIELDPNYALLFNMISVDPHDLSDLPDGLYHLAIVAEGVLRDAEGPRYRNQHLLHLKVEEGIATRLTQAQYSALGEPAQVVAGPDGRPVRVQRGDAIAGPRPAPGPASADPVERINAAGVPGSTTETGEK